MVTRAVACERCRGRKSRCGTEKPECSACVKAKVECVYPRDGPDEDVTTSGYTNLLEERLASLEKRLADTPGVGYEDRTSTSAVRRSFSAHNPREGRSEDPQSSNPLFSRERSPGLPSYGTQALDADMRYHPFALCSPRRERVRPRCDNHEFGSDGPTSKRVRKEYPGSDQTFRHADEPGLADDGDVFEDVVRSDIGRNTTAAAETSGTQSQIPSGTSVHMLPPIAAPEYQKYHDSRQIDRGFDALTMPALPDETYAESQAGAIDGGQSAINQPGPSAAPSTFQLLDRLPRNHGLELPTSQSFGNSEEQGPAGVQRIAAWRLSGSANEPSNKVLPPRVQAEHLVRRYLQHTNSTWALIHEPTLYLQLESTYRETIVDKLPRAFDVFVVSTVLAIACSNILKTDNRQLNMNIIKNNCWIRAKSVEFVLGKIGGWRKLQGQLLSLQYCMLNPEDGSIWDLSGSALRTAIDLGMHQKPIYRDARSRINYLERDMGNRLFWAAYCIDRNLGSALGRPPGIPDDWVDANLPLLVEDQYILQHAITSEQVSRQKLSVHQHIQLRKIQSEISQRLYSNGSARLSPPPASWFDEMQSKLGQWRRECHDDSMNVFQNPDWLDLNLKLTTSQLHRPCPGNEKPSRESLAMALKSSGETMRLFKKMYRERTINYAWLAIAHLFISGVTFLSSLCLADEMNGPRPDLVDAMLNIQACSSVLEALTSVEPGKIPMRDAFEEISVAVMRKLSSRPPTKHNHENGPTLHGSMTSGQFDNIVIQNHSIEPILSQSTYLGGEPYGTPFDGDLTSSDGVWETLRSLLFDPSSALLQPEFSTSDNDDLPFDLSV